MIRENAYDILEETSFIRERSFYFTKGAKGE